MAGNRQTGLGLLRRMAHIVTVLVTMAYLLPALLTFIPSPASAEEQALYSDLMKSRCVDINGDGVPDSGLPANGGLDCCLMCAAPQPAGLPKLAEAVSIDFAPRPVIVAPAPQPTFAVPPSEAVFRPLSQRGPPA